MGAFDAFLAPMKPELKGPPISGKYLKGLETDFQPLPMELVPYVAKHQPVHGDLFHVPYEGQHYLIRCVTLREFELLSTLRRCFEPGLGFRTEEPKFNSIPIEDIFKGCILYPEELPEDAPAGLARSLVETAIENSGWDSSQDILLVQGYGRNLVASNLPIQILTFLSKAYPGIPQDEIYNYNMVKIMSLLAGAESILQTPFEITQPKPEKEGKKISRKVQIQEDLKAMREAGLTTPKPQ